MKTLSQHKRFPQIVIGLLCFFAFFLNLGSNGLWDLDEGLYANVAREMHMTGDYVVPRINGEPFFEKPPLIYWSAATCYMILGRNEFTTRLPSALASTIAAFLILAMGTRIFGKRSGLLASALFVLSPMSFGAARQLTTDATLNLAILGALICYWMVGIVRDERKLTWSIGFWVACALGVLAKGLPGILIPCVVVFLFCGLRNRFDIRKWLVDLNVVKPLIGIPIFLVVALPWHVLAFLSSGKAFTNEYIIKQHLQRFRGGDVSHLAPFWFYIPGFAIGAFPWSFFSLAALRNRLTGSEEDSQPDTASESRLLLKIWAAIVFLMFSASGSKLISYILPMYPAAALLVGDYCASYYQPDKHVKKLFRPMVGAFVISISLFGIIVFRAPIAQAIANYSHKPVHLEAIPSSLFQWAVALFFVWTAGTGLYLLLERERRTRIAFIALFSGMGLFLAAALFGVLPIIEHETVKPIQALGVVSGEYWSKTHEKLFVVTLSGRRPSVIFKLPDAMIGTKDRKSSVKEVPDKELVNEYIFKPGSKYIIADEKKFFEWVDLPGFKKLESRGGWALYHKD